MNSRLLDLSLGLLLGLTGAMALVILTTDVDTPVAIEPKCETIIIHK